jgi:hypothetical protein
MTPIRTSTGVTPERTTEWNTVLPSPNGVAKMNLLYEVLSRARMRQPQAGRFTTRTEAPRSARTVAMECRRQASRELGVV